MIDSLHWLIAPENIAGTLTYFAVYLCSPLLVSLTIEGIKTDHIAREIKRVAKSGGEIRRIGRMRIRAYQVLGTTALSVFIASGPGVLESAAAINHGIAAGLFSALTMHAIKALMEARWPQLHDAIFFSERRKRAAIQGRPFDPNDTTIHGPMPKRSRKEGANDD